MGPGFQSAGGQNPNYDDNCQPVDTAWMHLEDQSQFANHPQPPTILSLKYSVTSEQIRMELSSCSQELLNKVCSYCSDSCLAGFIFKILYGTKPKS